MKVTQDIHQRVVLIVNETLEKAKKIWPSKAHLIRPLMVDWEVGGVRVAGLARIGRDRVSYNSNYIGEDDFWDTTVPHEVAHFLQSWIYPFARQAHGPEFRSIMARLGHSTRTRHSMNPEALKEFKPNEYECPCCGKTFNVSNTIHRRIQMGQKRYCVESRCKRHQKINPTTSHIRLKGSFVETKEVSVKEIIPEIQKINLVTPKVEPKVVGAVKLSDIIPGGWWDKS